MFIRKGNCDIETGGKTFHAEARQVVFLNCYEPHSYHTGSGWEAEWLHFDGINALGYYEAATDNASPVISLKDTYRFEKYLHKIYRHFSENVPVKEALMNNYIVNILTELLTNKEMADSENVSSGIVEDIIAYIGEHLTEPLTLQQLAAQASLSPFYFSRLFKKETGFSPHEYLITARINNARFLLKYSDASIKDICFRTGFSNESSFCTTFKKITHTTPSEYRRSAVQKDF
jgi:AraC-like DNA-binding protein